jgi:DDE family transposase
VWERLHRVLLDRLGRAGAIDWSRACLDSASAPAKRVVRKPAPIRPIAAEPGPSATASPTPRDQCLGHPAAVRLTAATIHDSRLFAALIDAVPPIRHGVGRPQRRPAKLHADKGYDFPHCRWTLRRRSIQTRIARRGVESSERVERYRWVIKRTLGWFSRFRRLTIRYERRLDIFKAFFKAFHHLAAALISWRFVQRFC